MAHSGAHAIAEATYVLAEAGCDSPRADALALAEHVLGKPAYLAAREWPDEAWRRYMAAVGRRAKRVPLQHVTGKMAFRHLMLAARPGVFVVRPETEWVVEHALREGLGKRVVDWCAGSGAIGIAIASEVEGVDVHAVEIDSLACDLARDNARANPPAEGSSWTIHRGDATLPEMLADRDGTVDTIVTNPPYVPPGDVTQPEALADPERALYGGGHDGLAVPLALLTRAQHLLAPGGLLVMEHAESQADALLTAARRAGMDGRTGTDLAGRPRCLIARRRVAH